MAGALNCFCVLVSILCFIFAAVASRRRLFNFNITDHVLSWKLQLEWRLWR